MVSQLTHFFAVLLWVAAALALVARLPLLAVAIVVIVIVNAVFAFVQEYKAGQAAEKLQSLLPRQATVIRDGRRQFIEAERLVPGDLLVLEPGDRISADVRLVEVHDVEIDTSTFTGESLPATPEEGETAYAGTYVVAGAAKGIVTATGDSTRLAEIAELARAPRHEPTPLARELRRLVEVIATIAIAIGSLFFFISLLLRRPSSEAFIFAIGVTVALVPEGLLPTITLSLALSAQKMASQNALVRNLEAVETLGLTTVICTDKTGTLTRNEMSVVEVWTPHGSVTVEGIGYRPEGRIVGESRAVSAALEVARAGARCSDGFAVERDGEWLPQGDPTEVAIWVLARRMDIDVSAEDMRDPVRRRFPFDARRRLMSVVTGQSLFCKGAPDEVIERCENPTQVLERAKAAVESMADRGLRILAVAQRPAGDIGASTSREAAESGLRLLGLVGLEDTPRPESRRALEACRSAGIKVVMVTGDHPKTAIAIARELGLSPAGTHAIEGKDLPADEEELARVVDRDGAVLARISPEQKHSIAKVLRSRGHVVAMTGDGVNDAPALTEADVGVAMGKSGTDVARNAADMVLLDDNFATIVAAIERGRGTYANIRRFLTFHLTDNVAELTPFAVWALSGGKVPLALSVLQILALDIGTDALPALALGTEHPNPRSMMQPPPRKHLVDASVLIRAFGILGPSEALVEMAAFLSVLHSGGWEIASRLTPSSILLPASGAAFAAVVFGQSANAFACRSSTLPWWRLPLLSNRPLLYAVAAGLVLLVAMLAISPVAAVLGHAPPPTIGWIIAALSAPTVLLADALHKSVRRRLVRSKSLASTGTQM
jgi:calcium-translocating P-type ATPase